MRECAGCNDSAQADPMTLRGRHTPHHCDVDNNIPAPAATQPAIEPGLTPTVKQRPKGVTRSGTPRADTLSGTTRDDTLRGRGGNDVLRGLGGDDLLLGGPGRDKLYGGAANDQLLARDGRPDFVDCGPGRDVATADTRDIVKGCEWVARTG